MQADTVRLRGVVTAAGASSRMGRPKGLLRMEGLSFLERMISILESVGVDRPVGVVVGADRDVVAQEVVRLGADAIENLDYRTGRFSSIRRAANWALEGPTHGGRTSLSLLLWPVDCPGVAASTLMRLIEDALTYPMSNVVPVFEGKGGHPVLLCRSFLERIVAEPSEINLRDLMRNGGVDRRTVPVDDPAIHDNLNDPASYRSFLDRRAAGVGGPGADG